MGLRQEQWTQLNIPVIIEAPRNKHRSNLLFVSPGGMFVPQDLRLDTGTQLVVRFKVDGNSVTAHVELRRMLSAAAAQERGIQYAKGGTEMRIIRMEGDGSQLLAEHIKKTIMESGGPA